MIASFSFYELIGKMENVIFKNYVNHYLQIF